ncbi:hypothetical protein Pcinc_026193 [Petrolisthes cinctipes]|uniref:Uncharacterized protein n=1 Tax=Petrolisthes cinctipes TaxID=88211 RepID=A0AAE1F8Z6_PETCI|nr:hypothetical protein Pcinc_026193 [Petrolisthes cinctipes]
MADDEDYKASQADKVESEQPECSSNNTGVWRIPTITGVSNAASECGLGDSDDEDEHHHRDKFRGERSEYYSRSVKDWVDSTQRNTHAKWTNRRAISLRCKTQGSNNRESGRANSEDELEYSSISSRDSFDEAQYCNKPNSPGQTSHHSNTKDAAIVNGDDHLEYSSISSKESLHDDDEPSKTDDNKADETTNLSGTITKNNLPTESNVGLANDDDQLEYSSISSRESLHDEDDNDKCSDLDDLADPPTPAASAGSSATGPAKDSEIPKEYTVIDVDALEYSSISSKESLDDNDGDDDDDGQSNISDDLLPGHDLINSPDHLSEAHQDSEEHETPEPKITAQECIKDDNDDKLEDLSSSSGDCIDEVQSIGEDWNDQLSCSPDTITTHTHKTKDGCKLSPDVQQENHRPFELIDNDQERNLSDIDEQMECIDEVNSSSEEEWPEHHPSPGHTIPLHQDKECTENKSDNVSSTEHHSQKETKQQEASVEKDKEYPKEDNIAKAWMVVNGQTSRIKIDFNKYKFNIISAISLRHHVLLQVKIAYTCQPCLKTGAFALEMAQDSMWNFNRAIQRWEAILCQGGVRRHSSENSRESRKGDQRKSRTDRLTHRSGHSTKATLERGNSSSKDFKSRQHPSEVVDHERESSLISGQRSKNYHPETNNISKAWVVINGRKSEIITINKTKAVITAALKYRHHILLQVQLSMSAPRLDLGAFITKVARKAKWKYLSHNNMFEASVGREGRSQLERNTEDKQSTKQTRLGNDEPKQSTMLTFKAFMEQCDDSITEVEALRKYCDYKHKFETQQLKGDLNTNDDEEWMVLEEWRDDLKDGDEENGTTVDDKGVRVPSPENLPDHDHSSSAHTTETERTKDTVAASPPPQEPQTTLPRPDTNSNTKPDVSTTHSPVHSTSPQPKDQATDTPPVTPPSQPGRDIRPLRTRKPPQRYS